MADNASKTVNTSVFINPPAALLRARHIHFCLGRLTLTLEAELALQMIALEREIDAVNRAVGACHVARDPAPGDLPVADRPLLTLVRAARPRHGCPGLLQDQERGL